MFADNDVLIKVASLDLVAPLLEAAGGEKLIVTSTAKFQLGMSDGAKRGRRKYGDAVVARLEQLFANATEIIEEPPEADVDAMLNVRGIDPGEAILFSAASRAAERLATGDKKAIEALALAPLAAELRARLQGRVVCLEQVVLDAIERHGFVAIRAKVVPGIACDTSMRAAFGSGILADERNAIPCLEAAVADLRKRAGGLLR